MRILILGAGGHGQVVADAIRAGGPACRLQIAGYLDDDPKLHGVELDGVKVLGPLAQLALVPHDGVVVAIGSNLIRSNNFNALSLAQENVVTVSHPTAIISTTAAIGEGTMICAGVILNPQVRVGRDVILNTASSLDHHCSVGDHAHIGPGARLGGEVTVGSGAFIGIGAVVLPGVKVGAMAVVGGGAVVIRDVPDGSIVAGNPARTLSRV